ncbi:zf-HC2 domain-containing protein [Sphingomonas quercus]|uniref:Zf-HC2 domain-containing protein n=1 Tax=Sphingomonas quercus TaxID=2842451 RepID=A0ABS6BIH7_9SPHN|nr:zf-HC2 domain-containing protein [Sphingomonas quercus]
MSNIIPLHDRHEATRQLLPWYANGSLDGAEAARVAAHLAGCAGCRAELDAEHRLKRVVAALPSDPRAGWAALRARVAAGEAPRPRRPGWLIAAQAAALIAATAIAFRPAAIDTAPAYHALGSARQGDAGNVIVLFRPEARETEMRAALRAADARLVGGPTAANAYLLSVAAAERGRAVARLQASPVVRLAQPIDQDPAS